MTDLPTTPTMMLLHMMITSMIHEFSISHQVVSSVLVCCFLFVARLGLHMIINFTALVTVSCYYHFY